jgi:hypothetical protein
MSTDPKYTRHWTHFGVGRLLISTGFLAMSLACARPVYLLMTRGVNYDPTISDFGPLLALAASTTLLASVGVLFRCVKEALLIGLLIGIFAAIVANNILFD